MTEHEARELVSLLESLKLLNDTNKILNTFIPAFEGKSLKRDNWHWLHGSFNSTGTKSGRMSSSGPNLQQLPSTGTIYAKDIKKCFKAPTGWIWVGADFASLEDRISALLTKDKNKLKVYTDGYDGHSLRAYSYFKEQMPDINPDSVDSINSVQNKYQTLRQASKAPTFALTYLGTYRTLMKNCGFTEAEAKSIEANYHDLYQESDKWVQDRIETASKTGYVDLAFGLKLRTPLLKQSIVNSEKHLPKETHKEIKTAANALAQSYGLLNNRAANDFMDRVWKSSYATDILPSAQIHDAQYYLVRNDLDILFWIYQNLIDAMRWNDLESIQHDQVKLDAELEIFYPDWSKGFSIPNGLNKAQLRQYLQDNNLKK